MAKSLLSALLLAFALSSNAASVQGQPDVSHSHSLSVEQTLTHRFLQPLQQVHLVAPDGSAKASFIAYGATATNFWVKDKVGAVLLNPCELLIERRTGWEIP